MVKKHQAAEKQIIIYKKQNSRRNCMQKKKRTADLDPRTKQNTNTRTARLGFYDFNCNFWIKNTTHSVWGELLKVLCRAIQEDILWMVCSRFCNYPTHVSTLRKVQSRTLNQFFGLFLSKGPVQNLTTKCFQICQERTQPFYEVKNSKVPGKHIKEHLEECILSQ